MIEELEGVLPGRLCVAIGSAADYRQLARFHYTARSPASFALTVVVELRADAYRRRVIAVGVLSYPALNCRARERALSLGKVPREWRWAFLNRHLRTISRVIVHPEFRGVGLSTVIIRALVRQAPTRYVEAIARMASVHPLFERAGLACIEPGDEQRPAYHLVDRLDGSTGAGLPSRNWRSQA